MGVRAKVSGHRSEQCWAAQRHLPDVCPMVRTCEATTLERDALRVEVAGLRCEIALLRGLVDSLSERVAGQAEILTQRAERSQADDLRDGEGEG